MFISFEGIEGAGKSTLIESVSKWLDKKSIDFIQTREPGGCELAEEIRSLLLQNYKNQMAIEAEVLLLMAARVQHLQEIILPSLAKGKWVISDRFRDATFAYQGGGRGIAIDKLLALESWIGEYRLPDKTFYLDLSLEESKKRQATRAQKKDRFEQETDIFFEKVRNAYLALAAAEPERIAVIDASQSPEAVFAQVQRIISGYFVE